MVGMFTVLYITLIAVITLPGFFGYQVEVVTSGSMEPGICAGAVIYVKRADFESIDVNDVITYRLKDGKTKVTHRVLEKNTDRKSFITKGDANDEKDTGEVEYARVEGKVACSVALLGRAALLLTNVWGKSILAIFLLALLLLRSLLQHPREKQQEGKAKGSQAI